MKISRVNHLAMLPIAASLILAGCGGGGGSTSPGSGASATLDLQATPSLGLVTK
jgi:hypothetical protein